MRIQREKESNYLGQRAEDMFKETCEKMGFQVIRSSREQDIHQHVDFLVNNGRGYYGVDVKGNANSDCIWVEFKNVKGKAGWLYGGADYIAFNLIDKSAFAVVSRVELEARCMDIVKPRFVNHNKAKHSLYTRDGRQDVISRLVLEDIVTLKSFKLMEY